MATISVADHFPFALSDIDLHRIGFAHSYTETGDTFAAHFRGGDSWIFKGDNLTFDAHHHLTGGTITSVELQHHGHTEATLDGLDISATSLASAAETRTHVDDHHLFQAASNGDDTLTGAHAADWLQGFLGNDTLRGHGGPDLLDGGNGSDALFGNSGNDLLLGRNGNDTLSGGNNADHLSGGNGRDTLSGGSGFDHLSGGNGRDTLFGNSGDDLLLGGNGKDTLSGGNNADHLFGGAGSDTLLGGGGFDHLSGGSGRDVLDGGAGHNVLHGGSGADTFVFNIGIGLHDSLATDFSLHQGDQLELKTDAGVDPLPSAADGTLDADVFHVGRHTTDAEQRVLYNQHSGALSYDPDGAGGVHAVQIGMLDSHLHLTAADFLVA